MLALPSLLLKLLRLGLVASATSYLVLVVDLDSLGVVAAVAVPVPTQARTSLMVLVHPPYFASSAPTKMRLTLLLQRAIACYSMVVASWAAGRVPTLLVVVTKKGVVQAPVRAGACSQDRKLLPALLMLRPLN